MLNGESPSFVIKNTGSVNRIYDTHYRPAQWDTKDESTTILSSQYAYTATGLISQIDDLTSANKDQQFNYDAVYRLTNASGAYGTFSYTYDAVGNRETRNWSQANDTFSETYAYPSDSHQLSTIVRSGEGAETTSIEYTDAGNIDTKGNNAFTYNDNNRLIKVSDSQATIATYQYNAFGQRVVKTANNTTQHFHFNLNGQLISESRSSGAITREYIYLNGEIIAALDIKDVAQANGLLINQQIATAVVAGGVLQWPVVLLLLVLSLARNRLAQPRPSKGLANLGSLGVMLILCAGCGETNVPANTKSHLYFVHTDHLGTPKVITNQAKDIIWEVESTPFGESAIIIEDIEFNVRFPGQYADKDSGLSYNYFRDYDSSLGRYIQSDPIGLRGGLNTYAYVGGSPTMYIDPFGLDKCRCKAPQTGSRVNGEKICTYTCNCETACGIKYTKTIQISAGSGKSTTCKGQWQDLYHPNPNKRTGFTEFAIDTDGVWDNLFNGDFVDALD